MDAIQTELLAHIDPAWLPLLDAEAIRRAVAAIIEAGDAERTTPAWGLVFEALRYGAPADIHTVIVGQDPYPGGEGQGLCFSVRPGVAPPPSLRNILAALAATNHRAGGDLRSWAAQGVLMVNATPTTRRGVAKAHESIWRGFTAALLGRLARAVPRLNFLLWGAAAGALAAALPPGHRVLTWGHPSPLGDNAQPEAKRFRNCPHFEIVNEGRTADERPPVVWGTLEPVTVFADGGCLRNGKANAVASYAAVFFGGLFGDDGLHFRGIVPSVELCAPAKNVAPSNSAAPNNIATSSATSINIAIASGNFTSSNIAIAQSNKAVAPSNNRGEMLAIALALAACVRAGVAAPVEVVSDSEICVKTLTSWLPTRLRAGTEAELKNLDLVMFAWEMLAQLRAQAASVTLTHVRGHGAAPPPGAPARARLLHRGNALADAHATEALGEPGVEFSAAPAMPYVVRMLHKNTFK